MVETSEDEKSKTGREKVTRTVNLNAENKDNEDSLVQDARNSLLAHYSSKSSNGTAILLGLAIAFFAAVQAYSDFAFPLPWKITVFAFVLGFILFLVFHEVGRLVYYGELVDAITVVEMLGRDVTKRNLNEINKELEDMRERAKKNGLKKLAEGLEGVEVVSSPLLRLNQTSSRYVDFYCSNSKENRRSILIRILHITNNPWFPICYAVIAIVGYLLLAYLRLFTNPIWV